MLQFKDNLEKYFPNEPATFTSPGRLHQCEGYSWSGLIATAANLNTETLIDKLETIRDLDLGTGAKLTFDIGRHQASNRVWGIVLDAGGRFQVLEME